MFVACVTVHVHPGREEDFIRETLANHEGSVKEPGNLRFDLLQAVDDSCRFFLYEAYRSEEDARAHKETSHYLTWRERVADWMVCPREGVTYRVVAPDDPAKW